MPFRVVLLLSLACSVAVAAPVPKAGNADGLIWVHREKSRELAAYTPDGKVVREVKYADGERYVGVATNPDAPDGVLVFAHNPESAKLVGYRTDGKVAAEFVLKDVVADRFLGFTPDGAKVAFLGNNPKRGNNRQPVEVHGTVFVLELKRGAVAKDTGFQQIIHTDFGSEQNRFSWSPDGTRLLRVRATEFNKDGQRVTFHTLFDLASGKEREVEVPTGQEAMRRWPDEKSFLTIDICRRDARILRIPADGGKPVEVYKDRRFNPVAVSPDGSAILCFGEDPSDTADPAERRAMVLNTATGKLTRMADTGGTGWMNSHWSPDGKRVVCEWMEQTQRSPIVPRSVIVVVSDWGGKNANTILMLDGVEESAGVSLVGWFPATVPEKPDPRRKNAPVPKAGSADGTLLVVTSDGVLRLLAPDGKELKKLDPKEGDGRPSFARLSPDGKRVVEAHRPDADKPTTRLRLRTLDTDTVQELTEVQHLSALFWSADDSSVYASGMDIEAGKDPNKKRHECWLNYAIDAKTGKAKPLDLGGEYRITGSTADGKSFVTVRTFGQRLVGKAVWGPELETHLTDRTTLKHTKLIGTETEVTPLAAFPDGKRWLVQVEDGAKPWVRVYEPAEKMLTPLAGWSDDGVMNRTIRLSPDGKRLAFVRLTGPEAARRWELVVSDADGNNQKVLLESKPPVYIPAVDWR